MCHTSFERHQESTCGSKALRIGPSFAGLLALEGVVETDWTSATFTMNWKITAPDTVVRFEAGEPCCMILPVPRGYLEQFKPVRQPLSSNSELAAEFENWSRLRSSFQARLKDGEPETIKRGWQKDYFHGKDPGDEVAFPEHQTKLKVLEFGD